MTVARGLEGVDFDARTALLFSQDRFIKSLEDGFVRRNFDLLWVYRQLFTSGGTEPKHCLKWMIRRYRMTYTKALGALEPYTRGVL